MCSLSLRAFSYLARSESALKVELAASQTYLYSRSEIGSCEFFSFFYSSRVSFSLPCFDRYLSSSSSRSRTRKRKNAPSSTPAT